MRNFLISSLANLILIFLSYFLFRFIISGPNRHKLYEKMFSSLSKFIIFLFIISISITGITTFILYKTSLIAYVNMIAPAILSVLVGFIVSTVPTKGVGDNLKEKNKF